VPRLLPIAVVIALSGSVLARQNAQTPDALARALQQHYQSISDFKADFVQTVRSGYSRTQSNGAGNLSVKKPGRMRWEYTKPEKQTYVSDGVKIYYYIPEEKRVYESDAPTGSEVPTFLLFLAGKGDITRDFTSSRTESQIPGTVALKLTPRKPEPDYVFVILAVDPKSLQVRQLMKRDEQGGESTITFSNLKENTGISDATFAFKPPKGVEVLTEENTRRP
jgi:outer membrane lipoprotein carrier protein